MLRLAPCWQQRRQSLRRALVLVLMVLVLPAAPDGRVAVTSTAARAPRTENVGAAFPLEVEWRVPVGCDFSGFFVEVVLGFVPFLAERLPAGAVWLLHEGCPDSFLDGKLTAAEAATYRKLQRTDMQRSSADTRAAIVIEHGAPCLARKFSPGQRPRYLIARSMSEGTLPAPDAACLLQRGFDEIWVPTQQHIALYVMAGLQARRLLVMPEAVATEYFSRLLVQRDELLKWRASAVDALLTAPQAAAAAAAAVVSSKSGGDQDGDEEGQASLFVFVSVFKWEQRKGWDALLSSYWREFGGTRYRRQRAQGRQPRVLLRRRTYRLRIRMWPCRLEPPRHSWIGVTENDNMF
jgi:hypothetical protein